MALPPAFAESLFLKDGSIIEGEMAGENEKEIRVKRSDGIVSTIQRENIIRILMIDDYKKKVYIYKKDGSMVQAHVVEEDRKFYYLRTDLASPQEMKVPREEVKIISDVAVDTGEKGIKTYGWVSLSFAGLTIGGIVGVSR